MLRQDQRVDPREAEEVVRLAAARHAAPAHDGPTVGGLAEALGLPETEVERLLADVRSRRAPVESSERRFGDRSAALSAAIVLALVVVLGLVFGGIAYAHAQAAEAAPPRFEFPVFPEPDVPTLTPVPDLPSPPHDTTIIESDGSKTTIKNKEDGSVEIQSHEPPVAPNAR